jgi:hypothetical protein
MHIKTSLHTNLQNRVKNQRILTQAFILTYKRELKFLNYNNKLESKEIKEQFMYMQ